MKSVGERIFENQSAFGKVGTFFRTQCISSVRSFLICDSGTRLIIMEHSERDQMIDYGFTLKERKCLQCIDTVGWAAGRASGL